MPNDPNRVRDLFLAAVELAPEGRAAFLAEACGPDPGLRAEVERRLAAHGNPVGTVGLPADAAGTFTWQADPDRTTDHPAGRMGPGARVPGGPGLAAGAVIAGRYTLVEVIGEGGMGSVYLAEQTEPVKRQVALKLIRAGRDSTAVLARFDAERQALALMDHPNIAKVFDGGTTPAGQPFFVMELVRGVPLTEYCDAKRLSVRSRLEVFVAVCQAVQHAHQKGVIHRDLKPSNVLVTEVDGRPTPKVIDFGVAKATDLKLTDQSFADAGAIVGTPAYMSPEQADPASMDIDTRTDVYALGVMLYELLAGSPPLDAGQFRRGAVLEMLRMVREVDPPRPSTKLGSAADLPNIAANRGIEPAKLAGSLRGELDWVVMKAIEKDRTRRYESATGLARDVQRYLADEVVEARPPSAGYRLRKLVRRHKGRVVAAGLVVLSLLGGMVGTTLGLVRATRSAEAERVAKVDAQTAAEREKQAADKEKAAREEADKESKLATEQSVLALGALQTLIVTARDQLGDEPKTQALKKALLDTALKAVGQVSKRSEQSTSIEATRAAAHMQLGQLFKELGESQKALAEFRRVHEIAVARVPLKQGSDASRRNLAAALYMLGDMDKEVNRDMAAALARYQEALALWEEIDRAPKADDKGEGKVDPVIVKTSLAELNAVVGATHFRLGVPAVAVTHFRKALELRRALLAGKPGDAAAQLDVVRSLLAMGDTSFRLHDPAAAVAAFDECLKIVRAVSDKYPKVSQVKLEVGRASSYVGDFYLRSGDLAKAKPLLEAARALAQELVNLDERKFTYQWDLGLVNYRLGLLAERSKDPGGAKKHFESCLAIREKLATQDQANDRRQMEYMLALAHSGRTAEAEAIATRLLRGKPDAELLLDVARCHSQCAARATDPGEQQRHRAAAVDVLRRALKLGYRDEVYLSTEIDLEPLRSDPAFAGLIEAARAGGP